MDRIDQEGERMKKIVAVGILVLLFSMVMMGCTPLPPETTVPSSVESPVLQTDQQILQEHPDNLDQALEELEMIG